MQASVNLMACSSRVAIAISTRVSHDSRDGRSSRARQWSKTESDVKGAACIGPLLVLASKVQWPESSTAHSPATGMSVTMTATSMTSDSGSQRNHSAEGETEEVLIPLSEMCHQVVGLNSEGQTIARMNVNTTAESAREHR